MTDTRTRTSEVELIDAEWLSEDRGVVMWVLAARLPSAHSQTSCPARRGSGSGARWRWRSPSAARSSPSRARSHGAVGVPMIHTSSAMPYEADPRVDAYIDALPEWQQKICRQVRDLVRAADPDVAETIKRTSQPYFVLDGNICALLAAKDHVNVFLYDGGIVPDPEGIITAGHDNKTARTVAFREGEPINAAALTQMIKQIIANNRAGGWRKLKPRA